MQRILKIKLLIVGLTIFIFCFILYQSNPPSEASGKLDSLTQSQIIFPSYDPRYPPPVGFKGAFELRQNYPKTYIPENYPWLGIDFRVNPKPYLQAVLAYCLEGNTDPRVDFNVKLNRIRTWYHAPWLHDDGRANGNGREYIHGLTRERSSSPFELHRRQNVELENWAIGFYNAPGGFTLGQVWQTGPTPNPRLSNFPEGTVSFKLLFTSGTVNEVPFLSGSKQWWANIYPCNPQRAPCPNARKRANRLVTLLQIDVAVKDSRAGATGWVFGTFIYNAAGGRGDVWQKMVPVGLSWGDDSRINSRIKESGAFENPELRETYLNRDLIEDKNKLNYAYQAYMRHYGLGGRLNGPVDNPISSCISCHARAGVSSTGEPRPLGNFQLTPRDFTPFEFGLFFSTIRGGAYPDQFGSKTYMTTDYSLQLGVGIRNFYNVNPPPGGRSPSSRDGIRRNLPELNRGEKNR